jgi:hypothetical protein
MAPNCEKNVKHGVQRYLKTLPRRQDRRTGPRRVMFSEGALLEGALLRAVKNDQMLSGGKKLPCAKLQIPILEETNGEVIGQQQVSHVLQVVRSETK